MVLNFNRSSVGHLCPFNAQNSGHDPSYLTTVSTHRTSLMPFSPPDNTQRLSVQLGKTYPYTAPKIDLRDVRGLRCDERTELLDLLKVRSTELAHTGSVMACELVQEVEGFLLEHNRDPRRERMSAWESMREREADEER